MGREGRIARGGGDDNRLVGVLFRNLEVPARRHDDGGEVNGFGCG